MDQFADIFCAIRFIESFAGLAHLLNLLGVAQETREYRPTGVRTDGNPHLMGAQETLVVFFLSGNSAEHSHRQPAGQRFGDGKPAGFGKKEISGVHIFFHMRSEIDQFGPMGAV